MINQASLVLSNKGKAWIIEQTGNSQKWINAQDEIIEQGRKFPFYLKNLAYLDYVLKTFIILIFSRNIEKKHECVWKSINAHAQAKCDP